MDKTVLLVAAGVGLYLATRKPPPAAPPPVAPTDRLANAGADIALGIADRVFRWWDEQSERAPSTPPGLA